MQKNNLTSEKKEVLDHREIGKRLKIFSFIDMAGAGLPFWEENGNILRELIIKFINNLQKKNNIKMVKTPILGSRQIYENSGHLEHYSENIFPGLKIDNKEYFLRPMTCPHHVILLKKNILRENMFPIAYGENAILHRYEYSGGLSGLERVRAMELIDTHIFILKKQINKEINKCIKLIFQIIEIFEINLLSVNLSFRDKKNTKKYFKNTKIWNYSEKKLSNIIEKYKKKNNQKNILFKTQLGDAAFYGPKIDFQIETKNKKEITLSTIQLDFLLPKKFDLCYLNEKNESKYPIIIHLGLIGTLERFIAYLLEKNNGKLAFWLTPIQIIIIPINNEKHLKRATSIFKLFEKKSFRVKIDSSKNSLLKKIRTSQIQKIPFQIVVGDKENKDKKHICYKKHGEKEEIKVELKKWLLELKKLNTHKKNG